MKSLHSFLVFNVNGLPIWKSEKLKWVPSYGSSVSCDVQVHPPIFALVSGELTVDVMTQDNIFIMRFKDGRKVTKGEKLPDYLRLTINPDGEISLVNFEATVQ